MGPQNRRNPKSGFWPGLPSPIAVAGMVATIAIVMPVRAATLNNWSFDATARQLTLTLPNEITPDFFLLAEPARIVLRVPNTTLGRVAQSQQYSGAIRSIRLSEVEDGTRVVIELAPNTLLDPRHAELTSTDMGNGQTRWTLRPLLQDVAPASVAASTPTSPPAAAEPVPSPESTNAAAAPPALTPDAPAPAAPPPLAAPALPVDLLRTETASEAADSEPVTEPMEEPATPIAVIPPPDSSETSVEPALPYPSLPEVANSVTVGAAQALPSGPDAFSGVSTEAAVLAGVGEENLSDLPPEQIPVDPFAVRSQAAVSVPSSTEADRTLQPQVSVPSIAEVPAAPALPQPSAPAVNTAVAPELERPPEAATTPPSAPVATAPAAGPEPAPAAAPPAGPAIAANSIEIPPIPLPPDNWRDQVNGDIAPNQIRPPQAEAIARTPSSAAAEATASPPSGAVPTASPAASIDTPPPASATASAPTTTAVPPPPSNASDAVISTPPPAISRTAPVAPSAPTSNSANPAAVPPPPFLEGPSPPRSAEQPSIPPPPSTSRETETVPFGSPLPQTKALNYEADPAYRSAAGIPVGTRLALQYAGAAPLVLAQQDPIYEVLTLTNNVYDPHTGALMLTSGTQVLGRFEGFDDSGRRFVAEMAIEGSRRRPLLAESDWLVGTPQPDSTRLAIGSGIGAAAVTLLAGLSGIGILGGAALGAVAGVAESPTLVSIEPGQVIEVEVVADVLPFHNAPGIAPQYR